MNDPAHAAPRPAPAARAGGGNRYAIPLSVLVGGAYVSLAHQIQEQPATPVPEWTASGALAGPDGDGGGDGGD